MSAPPKREPPEKDVADAKAAMAVLVARMPRRFGYADEIALVFKAKRDG